MSRHSPKTAKKTPVVLLLIFTINTSIANAKMSVEKIGHDYVSFGESNNENDEKAEEEACLKAKRELITYIFGAYYQVNQSALKSFEVNSFSEDVDIYSKKVILRGVALEKNKGTCKAHYPISEAEAELKRLNSVGETVDRHATVFEGDTNVYGGTIEIITDPPDAEVYIDDNRWGLTPVKISGKISLGEHTIRIDHPNHELIEKNVNLALNSSIQMVEKLTPAKAFLDIHTGPGLASIRVNGIEAGKTPIEAYEVRAGVMNKIEAKTKDNEMSIQYIKTERDETRKVYLELPSKDGQKNEMKTDDENIKPKEENRNRILIGAGWPLRIPIKDSESDVCLELAYRHRISTPLSIEFTGEYCEYENKQRIPNESNQDLSNYSKKESELHTQGRPLVLMSLPIHLSKHIYLSPGYGIMEENSMHNHSYVKSNKEVIIDQDFQRKSIHRVSRLSLGIDVSNLYMRLDGIGKMDVRHKFEQITFKMQFGLYFEF